jgi:type II secretory pathway pseudopilin PulG
MRSLNAHSSAAAQARTPFSSPNLSPNPVNLVNPVQTPTSPSLFVNPVRIRRAAFSLIEIVLALGIISFALVGIMGLFPVAMKSAQESQRETRSAHIAQQIFSDLALESSFIAIGPDITTQRISIDRGIAGTYTIYLGPDNEPTGTIYDTSATSRIVVTVLVDQPQPGVSQIKVSRFSPADPATTNPAESTFVTLMKN